ncbi:MAG: Ig-like domain-containing protein [Phycisphaerae bacterium]
MKPARKTIVIALGVIIPAIVVWADSREKMTVATAPPVVISTTPVAGVANVDPNTKEIRVTFSKPMMDKSWSWSQTSDAAFPEIDGDIRYDKDGRTSVLPVRLEPGRTYAIWLNSQKFGNFKDRDGRSAIPYMLVFQTKKTR